MMNPTPARWSPPASATTSTRAAFETLARRQQRLLEAVVFEGATCTQLARASGATATDIRHELGATMLALYAQLAPADRAEGGAVAAMLVLRALDALDPDETELIDVMLLHRPELQRIYAGYEDLVGELCACVPRITPAPRVLAQLTDAIDDDAN